MYIILGLQIDLPAQIPMNLLLAKTLSGNTSIGGCGARIGNYGHELFIRWLRYTSGLRPANM
jgi:hypothetical protein